ncbi:hypothetical protein H0O03_02510 [Candidatus Micrarchaeota archaeon]|nr:hypothetical protein [Candidatus Micrarchaeota archaeon]
MERREWFSPSEVEWLRVSERKLGEGAVGKVFAGRIKFRGKKPFAVAVKQFKPPYLRRLLEVWHYPRIIEDLKRAGVRMPKMAFVEHEGQPVLVSELFQKARLTKISDAWMSSLPEGARAALVETLTKVMNAGYDPSPDSIGFVSTSKGPQPIVCDLDSLRKEPPQTAIRGWLTHFPKGGPRQKALEALLNGVTHPVFKKELERVKYEVEKDWFWSR